MRPADYAVREGSGICGRLSSLRSRSRRRATLTGSVSTAGRPNSNAAPGAHVTDAFLESKGGTLATKRIAFGRGASKADIKPYDAITLHAGAGEL